MECQILGRVSVPMWPFTLSSRLLIVALVSRYLTNQLIRREHPEVARFEKAAAYLAKHPDDKDSTKKELLQEQTKLVGEIADLKAPLTGVQEDLNLRPHA